MISSTIFTTLLPLATSEPVLSSRSSLEGATSKTHSYGNSMPGLPLAGSA